MHANNSQLLLRHISCSDVTILQSSTQYLNQAEEDNIAFQLSYFPTSPPEVADAAPCESMFTRRSVVRVSSDPESFINNNGRIEFNPDPSPMVIPPVPGVTVPGCACDIIITRTNVVVSKVPLPSNKRGNMLPRAPAPPAPPIPPIIIIRRRSLVSLRESFKMRGRSMFMSSAPAPPAAPPSPPLRRRIINKESLPLRMEEFVRRRSGRIPPRPPAAPPVPPRPPLPRREKRRRSFVCLHLSLVPLVEQSCLCCCESCVFLSYQFFYFRLDLSRSISVSVISFGISQHKSQDAHNCGSHFFIYSC